MARRRKTEKQSQSAAQGAHKRPLPMGLIAAVASVLVLGGIPFALGKYIELNTADPFDGGAYAYSAQRLLNGARLWVDEMSTAQPGTLLCNVVGIKLFGFGDTGPNIIQMLLQIAGLAMVFYTLRRLFGNVAAVVSTALAAILLSAPVVAKFGNVKEQFMLPFAMVAACAFALYVVGGQKRWVVLAGAAAIIPYYFKATGLAIVAAMGLFFIFRLVVRPRQWKNVFADIALWVGAAAVGLCFPATLFVWQGAMDRFWTTFPVILLQGIVLFGALVFAGFWLYHYIAWRTIGRALRGVDRRVWLGGAAAIVLMLIVAMVWVSRIEGAIARHDIPAFLWSLPFVKLPTDAIRFVFNQAFGILEASGILAQGSYVGLSRQARSYADQAPQVLRYYHATGAVTYSALVATLLVIGRWGWRVLKKQPSDNPLHAIAALLACWWLIDMAFVWISPHSYEQYYLPLCASGAMLAAYPVWLWTRWLGRSANPLPVFAAAGISALVLLILINPLFAGFANSPDTGTAYQNQQTRQPERRRGFAQSLAKIRAEADAPWEMIGDHIRNNSTPDQTLYVWGWVPGIYVRAERMAPVARAFEGEMHVMPPEGLARQIETLVSGLEINPPRFIVDSLKRHFPFNRPPFELWPIVPANMFSNPQPRLLGVDPREIQAFEQAYAEMLRRNFGDDEARRFAAMKPFRDFVRTHYRPVRQFGAHMLFEYRQPIAAPSL